MKNPRQDEPRTPIRVAFLINSMVRGGAERTVHTLLEALSGDKRLDITLILLENERALPIPATVPTVALFKAFSNDAQKVLLSPLAAVRLRRLTQRYRISVVLSFLERSNFVNVLARIFGSRHRVVISEHTDPHAHYQTRNLSNRTARCLIRTLYAHADEIVAVSSGVQDSLCRNFGVLKKKVHVVYDPCEVEGIGRLAQQDPSHPWFSEGIPVVITAGRLVPSKGHAHLIRAFAAVRQQQPCRLMLLGEGLLRGELERLAATLKVENDVAFLGWQENPYQYLSRATVFAFPSLWEGFGISLVEALACGLPVVSFDCPTSPREILASGRFGILVPVRDEHSLAMAILALLKDEGQRLEFAKRGKVRALDFDVPAIALEYRRLLEDRSASKTENDQGKEGDWERMKA